MTRCIRWERGQGVAAAAVTLYRAPPSLSYQVPCNTFQSRIGLAKILQRRFSNIMDSQAGPEHRVTRRGLERSASHHDIRSNKCGAFKRDIQEIRMSWTMTKRSKIALSEAQVTSSMLKDVIARSLNAISG